MADKIMVALYIWITLIGTTLCLSIEFDRDHLYPVFGSEDGSEGSEGSADGIEGSEGSADGTEGSEGSPDGTEGSVKESTGITCHTVYEDTWQTVYHEYEESVCSTFKEQVCKPFTRTSCSSVERRECGVHNVTECGLDYTDEVDDYVETECEESCKKECEYHWETETDGSKVWVPDESTCTINQQTNCQDVQKQKKWKKYTAIAKTKQEEKCELVSHIECKTIEDQICFEITKCDCNQVHKKVPVRVSTKVAKRKCQKERHSRQPSTPRPTHPRNSTTPTGSGSSPPIITTCPIVPAKSHEECRGQKSTCWSPGVADLDCPKHGNTGVSDLDWGYCCFDGCANTCLNPSSPLTLKTPFEKYTNPCTPNPCGTDAMCIPQEGLSMCKCPEGMFPDPTPEVACRSSLIDLRNTEK